MVLIGFCLGLILGATIGLIGGVTATFIVIENHGTSHYVPIKWIEDEEMKRKWKEEVRRARDED